MKEIQISPVIDAHDLATKREHAIRFLNDGMKVQVKLRFRGRQKAHKDIGFQVVNQFVKDIAPHGQADSPPKMLGDRDINVILSPVARSKRLHTQAAAPERSAAPPAPSTKIAETA